METISDKVNSLSEPERELIKELIKDKIDSTDETAIIFQHHKEKELYLHIFYMLGNVELIQVEKAALTVLITSKIENTSQSKEKSIYIDILNKLSLVKKKETD